MGEQIVDWILARPKLGAGARCEIGAECGGQAPNECGSACPRQCGVDAGICSTACVSGFFCPAGSSWDGASASCVLTAECPTSGR
jgi:hypothetical protein